MGLMTPIPDIGRNTAKPCPSKGLGLLLDPQIFRPSYGPAVGLLTSHSKAMGCKLVIMPLYLKHVQQ